jgi:hypothetical protein
LAEQLAHIDELDERIERIDRVSVEVAGRLDPFVAEGE